MAETLGILVVRRNAPSWILPSMRTFGWITLVTFASLTSEMSSVFGQDPAEPAGAVTAPAGVSLPDGEAVGAVAAEASDQVTDGVSVFSQFTNQLDGAAGDLSNLLAKVIFFDVTFGRIDNPATPKAETLPLSVCWLVLSALYFTCRLGFINLRGFKHSLQIIAGRYDSTGGAGEVSHFQALTAALSATVGLGNIAGVAIAIATGGPGATVWMILAGLLGMSSKFVECTLGLKYRQIRPDGRVMGGAMYYLSDGLAERGMKPLGKFLAVLFTILCIGGSFGGGCAFQVNQSMKAIGETVPFLQTYPAVYGALMTVLVGVVIIGGIRRIASTAEKIVPLMCGLYVLTCLYILIRNAAQVPVAASEILQGAFAPNAMYGGFLGVMVQGFRRAAFSNEAGVGSAAIAHSAAKTKYPIREGMVALLEPFVDTVVVCTMTALVIVITEAYRNPNYQGFIDANEGGSLTSAAMRDQVSWFPYILSVCVFLFAYSTMISWSYYGERCWVYLLGDRSSMVYRFLFLIVVFLGSIVSSTNILDLSDLMILGMSFPNGLGLLILSGSVAADLKDYWSKYKSGEFDRP